MIFSTPDALKARNLKYDGQLAVAVGRSRFEKDWKNKEMPWSGLVEKLSLTTRTRESLAEFNAMSKSEQDNVKDVGAFVGGILKGGRRTAGAVAWRQIVTLDADFAVPGLWDEFCLYNDYAACVYSTHKHRPEKPRLRFVIPLARAVNPDEYQAVSRMLAHGIGMDFFDDTTYQAHRLMYWPSTSADGEFYFQLQDGAWLDPDKVLAKYQNWQDQSQWPESSRTRNNRAKLAEKQGDPLAKPGIVGAFCRTYSIQQALDTFLSDIYEPCAVEGRYTYLPGSSAGGLVLYEDRFAYSHHGTDPIGGQLVNAFDLIRLHRFGDLDIEAQPGTAVNRMPSYLAMVEWAAEDENVRMTIGMEKLEGAQADFADIVIDPNDMSWLKKLKTGTKGGYLPVAENILLILKHDPNLAGKFAMDDFAHRIVVVGDLPWRPASQSRFWTDADEAALRNYCSRIYGIVGKGIVLDALMEVLLYNTIHPVRDYLSALVWDGRRRLDTLFVDYMGAADTEYTRAVTRKMLVAAVARVMNPGCKFDNMLVLVGKQGQGKSYLLKRIGRSWFSDSLTTVQGKDAYEQLQGSWILEMGELSAMRKAEVEAVKHFLSKQVDNFRVAYGRNISFFPRQCVVFGSTNKIDFLRDVTGNRRFWPVATRVRKPVKNIFRDLTDEEIDQLWAEAVAAYKDGETLYLDETLATVAAAVQEEHMEESEKFGQVQEFLEIKLPTDWAERDLSERRAYFLGDFGEGPEGTVERDRVCALEIWVECFGGDPKTFDNARSREIKDIMYRMPGWVFYKSKLRFGKAYGLQRCYVKSK
ncbi:VapE domain-containing protein [Anaeroselena agilis]|uniref:Virulence-associated E family protein n=1 Tax=Anaeroselena agilis TaxID=3063788 RepID=A0ABU3NUE8_9FIRM|nr:virulence-associated E family protein [Selenomonadales bacterium 4137-cl]